MTIYVSHSTGYNYKNELYLPIRNSQLSNKLNFILPHENSSEQYNTKELFQSGKCDLIIAECSYPSTGQGIELGWADFLHIPIAAIFKSGQKPSGALKVVSNQFIEYSDKKDDLVNAIELLLN